MKNPEYRCDSWVLSNQINNIIGANSNIAKFYNLFEEKDGLDAANYIKNIDKQKEFEHGEYFQRTLLELYKSLIRNDKEGYGYILESGQLQPKIVKEMIDFNNTIVLCLGLGNLTAEDMTKQCIKYDTKESWTYSLSKDYLLEHAKDWYNCNEMLKKECPKYGIRYIDTSTDREKILSEILEKLFI